MFYVSAGRPTSNAGWAFGAALSFILHIILFVVVLLTMLLIVVLFVVLGVVLLTLPTGFLVLLYHFLII